MLLLLLWIRSAFLEVRFSYQILTPSELPEPLGEWGVLGVRPLLGSLGHRALHRNLRVLANPVVLSVHANLCLRVILGVPLVLVVL